mgnify:CR=1 FL=1
MLRQHAIRRFGTRAFNRFPAKQLSPSYTIARHAAKLAAGAVALTACSISETPHAEAKAVTPSATERRVEDDYELLEKLGEGGYAVVHSARCKRTGKKVAIKCIPTTKQSAKRVRDEVEVLQRVSLHTCIVKFEDVYEDTAAGKFYIVMEVPCPARTQTPVFIRHSNPSLHTPLKPQSSYAT